MTDIRFYHLTRRTLEDVLPVMLERTLVRDKRRALVVAGSAERVEQLSAHLWTYNDRAFLPHGCRADGFAERQPIWLTDTDENPNGASVLFLTDGARSEHVGDFELVCTLFDGRDPTAVAEARDQWRALKDGDHQLSYWQQTEAGGWEQKAEA